jgi:hypothetical protein
MWLDKPFTSTPQDTDGDYRLGVARPFLMLKALFLTLP